LYLLGGTNYVTQFLAETSICSILGKPCFPVVLVTDVNTNTMFSLPHLLWRTRPASWSDPLPTNHRVPGSIPGSTVGIFSEGEDSRCHHGLGRLVEFRFKGPPGTTSSYITTHIIGSTLPRLMGVPTSEVGYTSAMPRREDHEVHKDMWGHREKKKFGVQKIL